jgi:hypothetical protein
MYGNRMQPDQIIQCGLSVRYFMGYRAGVIAQGLSRRGSRAWFSRMVLAQGSREWFMRMDLADGSRGWSRAEVLRYGLANSLYIIKNKI